jgi:hypothetical protein
MSKWTRKLPERSGYVWMCRDGESRVYPVYFGAADESGWMLVGGSFVKKKDLKGHWWMEMVKPEHAKQKGPQP